MDIASELAQEEQTSANGTFALRTRQREATSPGSDVARQPGSDIARQQGGDVARGGIGR